MKAIELLSAENGIFPKSAISILDVSFCFLSHESLGFQQKPVFDGSSDWVLCPHEAQHIPTGSGSGVRLESHFEDLWLEHGAWLWLGIH